jgi:prepilin-type N-terminal cleavage/methylation domain-containing protein
MGGWLRSAARRAGRWPVRPDDAGFSLVEVIVAISLMAVVMSAMGTFYVSSLVTTSAQSGRQAAMQLATDALERARALPVTTVEAGLPNEVKTVDGVPYTQTWQVATCRLSSGACVTTGSTHPYLRVTVTVSWTERTCPTSACSYAAATLVTRATVDPLFNTVHGMPPAIDPVADRTAVVNVAVTGLQLARSGGIAPWTWTVTGLPTGLIMSATGLITGTPTAVGPYDVVVTLRDRYSRTATEQFRWTVTTPPPVLTSPGDQTTTAGVAVNRPITRTSGTAPFVFTATGLPPGLAINAGTGTITGTPTTVGTSDVTVTVTDAAELTDEIAFSWIRPDLALAPPAGQTTWVARTSRRNVAITPIQLTVSGGVAPYAWSHNLPAGLSVDATGRITGTPTTLGSTSVRITVTDAAGTARSAGTFVWQIN